MTKLRTWLLHNTVLKFFSILCGLIIWILVADNSNPEIFDKINTDLLSRNAYTFLTSDQVYTLSSEKVEVSYKVRSNYADIIKASDFKAYIDFSELKETPGKYTLPVHVDTSASVAGKLKEIKAEPAFINIYTEKIQQKKFAVDCVLTGNVSSGYIGGEVELSPEYLYVKGPVSLIGQISSTGISIDIDGITSDLNGTTAIAFYDANGNEIPELEQKLSYAGDIAYTVPVYRTKSLSINAFAGGMPGTGYTVESVETSPTFISVYGPEEILNKHSYILIPGSDLNVAGISENLTKNIDISKYIPEGLTPVQNNHEITVYVKMRNVFEKEDSESEVPETNAAPEISPEATTELPESVSESAEKTNLQEEESVAIGPGREVTLVNEEVTEETSSLTEDMTAEKETEGEASHAEDSL